MTSTINRQDLARHGLALLFAAACALLSTQAAAGAQPAANNPFAPTAQRLSAGAALYQQHCALCHGPSMEGGEAGPALSGRTFASKWARQAQALFEQTRRTMPVTQPGGLTQANYADLTALMMNGGATPNAAAAGPAPAAPALPPVPDTEWLHHRGDAGSTNYSPLAQIDASNVSRLQVAWRWRSDNFGPTIWPNLETSPLMANGVLYATAGASRSVVAIDARTGETLWTYRIDEGQRGQIAPRKGPGRGLALWREGGRDVLFLVTPGFQLVALDARTGRPVESFGRSGIVDLKLGIDQQIDVNTTPIGNSSPPVVVGDVVIVGAAFAAGAAPPRKQMPTGNVTAWDVRTGERRWVFHTIAQPGDPGAKTWTDEARGYTGNAGVWAPFSADTERGLVYLPVEAPTSDFYGGERPGDNLYSSTLVCVDARTGERRWHFQLIHHDIWDYDIPAAPVLLDITVEGRQIPAVAQVTKQGLTYVFDRTNGKPVWPIVETRVPRSDVPGERSSPTQPIPSLPEPFERQGVKPEDLNDLTPEIHAEALRLTEGYRFGPLFNPPSVVTETNRGTLQVPGSQGGANWQGAVADPETGLLYVSSTSTITTMNLVSEPERSNIRYILGGSRIAGPFGLPLARPPWGTIVALDLKTGKRAWTIANGDTPAYVRNHEKLRGVEIPRTGHDDRAGLLVTKTLLFAGEGAGMFVASEGGTKFRAHDKATGEILFEMDLGLRQSGLPMSYAIGGKQYIVVAVGAPNKAGEFVALTLGEGR
ncbi:MAG: PQQ-binding-like beta-propeller repeat protein [Nevskiaceae bacterium]|nr:PQQ-binding-like beta-propeller repeat protein [Nevskiaceae bacterium]